MSTDTFDALFDEQRERIVRYVLSISRSFSRQDAEDIAQNTFEKFRKRLPGIAAGARISYLRQIARTTALDFLHDAHTRFEADIEEASDVRDPQPDAEELLARKQASEATRSRIVAALAELQPTTRMCVIERIRGRSYEEIGAKLRLSQVALRSRLSRAQRQLRERLGEVPEWFEWPEMDEEDGHGDEN